MGRLAPSVPLVPYVAPVFPSQSSMAANSTPLKQLATSVPVAAKLGFPTLSPAYLSIKY